MMGNIDGSAFALGAALGIGALAIVLLTRCWFRVQEGYLATLTTFGAAELEHAAVGLLAGEPRRLRTWGPGLHRKKPWQRVVAVAMMEQSLDLSEENESRSAIATDGTILRLDSVLRYTPLPERLYDFLCGMRAPLDHIAGLFTCLLRSEIANFGTDAAMGSFALIRSQRGRLNEQIDGFSREQIGDRYGVRFHAVDLTDISPPEELAEALNALMQAQTAAETLYFRAESDCQQRILAAEQGVRIAQANAGAIELEMKTLAGFLLELEQNGTLASYVARRRQEILAQARTVYWNELNGARP